MMIAGDESARWGFGSGKNWWGPHGNQGPLPSDDQRRIILPPDTKPWFKQYYSSQHVEAFGNEVHFLPLGSRLEFRECCSTPEYHLELLKSFSDVICRKMAIG